MTHFEAYRRLRAFAEGKPIPRGATRQLPISHERDCLIVAFVKMGGESSPWGIAWGLPGEAPEIQTIAEARDRDAVADLVLGFAPALLEHLGHPDYGAGGDYGPKLPPPLKQIWVPNPAHIDMLHYLDFAYTRTKSRDGELRRMLQALGRVSGWLFRESRRPGQTIVVPATEALRRAYTFPAEDARQAHLGFLLAWLEGRGGRESRMAKAAGAERLAIGTALDPALERDELEKRVASFNEAEKAGDRKGQARSEKEIGAILRGELERRWELVERSMQILRKDRRPLNPGLEALTLASRKEHWYQYLRLELEVDDREDGPPLTPRSETDNHPAAAGARFFVTDASQSLFESVLVHHDAQLQAEALAEGRAVKGTIVEVTEEGDGRVTIPVWTVESPGPAPTRLREGNELCVAGLPQRTLLVREIRETDDGWRFELEVTALKTRPRGCPENTPRAADPEFEGTRVTLLPKIMEGISRQKSWKIWRKDQPGSWLTRSVARRDRAGEAAELDDEVAEVDRAMEER